MTATNRLKRWDVFCHVVDNFGDIGVCWRLARQLADEHGFSVRLWVDDLAAFHALCPEIHVDRPEQHVQGIEIRRWQREDEWASVIPAERVVETFGCRLPDTFERSMARDPAHPPVWLNLEHLSAEAWVAACHALPSPHPHLPLTKYFFFPGFTENTGGLLRENALEKDRQAFVADAAAREHFLARLGVPDGERDTLTVSLFCYENAALTELLNVWAQSEAPVRCLVPLIPQTKRERLERFAQRPLEAGDTVRVGGLELCLIPFLSQTDYDRLLWSCDLNFVRGEDSFVRAQWAARPMFWQLYAQEENAHHVKLAAFLEAYYADDPDSQVAARALFLAWNGIGKLTQEHWERWRAQRAAAQSHAEAWQKKQMQQPDLCSRLVQFCQSRL